MPQTWRSSVKNASLFEPITEGNGPRVRVTFDGQDYDLPEGVSLAAGLLSVGRLSLRNTPVSGAARGPFCMMGACFDCLVEIDGVIRQACMIEVCDGLVASPAGRKEYD